MPLERDPDPPIYAADGPTRPNRSTRDCIGSTEDPAGTQLPRDADSEAQSTSPLDSPSHSNKSTRVDGRPRLPGSDEGEGPIPDPESTTTTITMPAPDPPSHGLGDGSLRTVGPYLLFELLGSGSQGEVWRALQFEPIRRTIALKLLRHHLSLNVESAERMRNEAERGGRLNHETV
jgi:hypothetical protein